ncbi:hypothetical protein E2C01_075262 [Portunus trituberculatus]|uniref:Uncharacterized protein n=1 Tax=Portunus trituberculatus TaxID=210409 RepID=A0A5B7IFE0_PORTR|nr:hypothetical protein [Portunus trituberculatus]
MYFPEFSSLCSCSSLSSILQSSSPIHQCTLNPLITTPGELKFMHVDNVASGGAQYIGDHVVARGGACPSSLPERNPSLGSSLVVTLMGVCLTFSNSPRALPFTDSSPSCNPNLLASFASFTPSSLPHLPVPPPVN